MDEGVVLATEIVLVMAVLIMRDRKILWPHTGGILHHDRIVWFSVFPAVCIYTQGNFPVFLCSVLLAVLITPLAGNNLLSREETVQTEVVARCGAVCSECSYFADNICPSCPEGDPELRKTCLIYECAQARETACNLCENRMRCETYRLERGNCPFEKDLFPLQFGMGYVIYEKNADESIIMLRNYVNRGEFGLLVSRRYPKQIKEKYDLKNVATVWLSTSEGEDNWIDPCNLSKLHHVISDFVRNSPVSIVLFEGFEYLMVRNSFSTALKFVQSLMDEIALRNSRLVLSINPDAFDKREQALIRRELIEL